MRQYRQDEAAWLRGLHVSLAALASEQDVEACEQRLQRLLQRLPPGSIGSLALHQQASKADMQRVLSLLPPLSQGLHELDLRLVDEWPRLLGCVDLELPNLRCARLQGNGTLLDCNCAFGFSNTPLLKSLQLESSVVRQLPPALERLLLSDVSITDPAAGQLFGGELMATRQS